MNDVTFRIVGHRSSEYYQALSLRHVILREPLGLVYSDEDIAAEAESLHVIGERFGQIIATLQLVVLADGGVMKMRQVAVAAAMQGKGIGAALVCYSEERAGENGCRRMELHAREVVVDFYKSQGYRVEGEQFMEVGIMHWKMVREL
jgi:predicted GNAT family N-acyltransferase